MQLMKQNYDKMMINPIPTFRSMTKKNKFHYQATDDNQRKFTDLYKNALILQTFAKRLDRIMVNGNVNAHNVGLKLEFAQEHLGDQYKLWRRNVETVYGKPQDKKLDHILIVNKF